MNMSIINKITSIGDYQNSNISHNIALILIESGVEDVRICTHFIAGKGDIEHLDIWHSGITCYPCINVQVNDRKIPLLWAILKYLDIKYSGGASVLHMQASFHQEQMIGWRVKNLKVKEFISDIVLYFHEMKRIQDEDSR